MFGESNEAAQLKTSLAKYSMEFNDLAVQTRLHRIAFLRLLGRPYTLLYVRRSVGRLHQGLFLSLRFWVTGSFNVAIPTLDSREAPYSGPFCEEKQRPGVEGAIFGPFPDRQNYRYSEGRG